MASVNTTSADDVGTEHLFKTWVRGAKGLEFLQEGLKGFVGDKTPVCRNQLLQNINKNLTITKCNQCTSQNLLPEHGNQKKPCKRTTCIQKNIGNCFGNKPKGRRKCPNGICSKLYDAIVDEHRFRDPSWKNTDPSTWSSDINGWSYAKCFETTLGPGKSAEETDASGLLSIIINNRSMQSWLACRNIGVATSCPFNTARKIRNEIMHKPKMELDEQRLDIYLDTFITVLQDPKCLQTYAKSRDAINKLNQLKLKQIHISSRDERSIRKIHEEALLELEDRAQKALQKLEDTTTGGMSALTRKGNAAKRKLQDTLRIGISDIKKKKTEALKEIDRAKSDVVESKKQKTLIVTHERKASSTAHTSTPGRLTAEIQPTVPAVDESYINMKTQFKDDLISLYRNQYSRICLSPLLIGEDTDFLSFYKMPDIKTVKKQRGLIDEDEDKTLVTSLDRIFFRESEVHIDKQRNMHSEIYLTADAGLGKTTFSKFLTLMWCHTKTPTSEGVHFSQGDTDVMAEFEFVFLLLLRESSTECDIDDLILNLIVPRLAHSSFTLIDLENILFKERCLVILDGLDEWTHPSKICKQGRSSIPHRKARECTILTTARPWTLSVCNLMSSQIDQKLKIIGLSQVSANALERSMISHLKDEKDDNKLKEHVEEFTTTVQENKCSDLETNPLLLRYMLCLWCEKKELRQTQFALYMNIIELLISRTIKKGINIRMFPKAKHAHTEITRLFGKNKLCRQFDKLLIALGQLAYKTLFPESGKKSLVFDSSIAEQYLNKKYLTLCFKTGLLTLSKFKVKLINQEAKVSFAHYTMQKIFATLYMYVSSVSDRASVPEILLPKCECVKDILEMSKTFIFLSGMNRSMLSPISCELMKIINKDETTLEYRRQPRRSSSESQAFFKHPLKDFQDICISCCKNLPDENGPNDNNLYLQDVFIDYSLKDDWKYLKQLTRNKQAIRSLSIKTVDINDFSTQQYVDYFVQSHIELQNIEKIQYVGKYNDFQILPLLKSSVKCLSLSCCLTDPGSFSSLLTKKVASLQKIEAICIKGFHISHSELKLLFKYISEMSSMREIVLWGVRCTDHFDSCTGSRLDLSEHSYLRKLTVREIPLSKLTINIYSLDECNLVYLSNPGLILRFLNCFQAGSELKTFICKALQSSAAVEAMLKALCCADRLKYLYLWNINLGNNMLPLSTEMEGLERITLSKVTMSVSAFRDTVNVLKTLPQLVRVDIRDCKTALHIGAKDEIETVKNEISESPHVIMVIKDPID